MGVPLRLLAEAEGVSAAQVVPDHARRRLPRPRHAARGDRRLPGRHLRPRARPDRPPPRAAGRRPRRPARARRPWCTPRTRRSCASGWPSSVSPAPATRSSPRSPTSRRSGSRASSRPPAAGTTARGCGSSRDQRTAPSRSRSPTSSGVRLLAEERVDFRRELSALVARSPSGQAAAYPVVASTQRDGICLEVVAPAPDLDRRPGAGGAADRPDRRPGARRHRCAGGRAVRDQRRPGARQRAGDATPQHRPLDPGRRGHLAVREPPPRGARPAARLAGAARALDGDGQHPRRRRRRTPATCTTATRTRWRATRGCGCTSTARTCGRAARSAT